MSVKRRNPAATSDIEAFAAGAETTTGELDAGPDPDAKRDYKALRVPFNEYEYRVLESVSKKTGRSKLNAIRWAIREMDKRVSI